MLIRRSRPVFYLAVGVAGCEPWGSTITGTGTAGTVCGVGTAGAGGGAAAAGAGTAGAGAGAGAAGAAWTCGGGFKKGITRRARACQAFPLFTMTE